MSPIQVKPIGWVTTSTSNNIINYVYTQTK